MNITDILKQIEAETGIDASEMQIVTTPCHQVLKEVTDGQGKFYIVTNRLTCKRCGHKWLLRHEALPLHCARCRSPYWNKDRRS